MKLKLLILALIFTTLLAFGCNEQKSADSRITMQQKVKSDNLTDNIITRPIAKAISAVAGEGIEINDVITRRNSAGLMEVYVKGYNRSYDTKNFEYYMEWFDSDGIVIDSVTNTWMPVSAPGKSEFGFKAVATHPAAVDFRMNTRKNRKVK